MYSHHDLNQTYDRTAGRCHLCGRKLAFTNYGARGMRAAWEVEHSRARARGGCDRPQNRFAACIECNRSKGTRSTKSVRRAYGLQRAPLSRSAREAARETGELVGGAIGAWVGYRAFGPWGALALGLAGASLGGDVDS